VLTPTSVKFRDAQILSEKHRDVIVYDPSSGDVCVFEDNIWPFNGTYKKKVDVISEIGTGFMDDNYTFIWIMAI